MTDQRFRMVFWFICGLTGFGAGFTVWLLIRFSGEAAERFADQAMIFWLTSAVGGGIGYLIGSSANHNKGNTSINSNEKQDVTVVNNPETKP